MFYAYVFITSFQWQISREFNGVYCFYNLGKNKSSNAITLISEVSFVYLHTCKIKTTIHTIFSCNSLYFENFSDLSIVYEDSLICVLYT